jgi:hypothetical protein
MQTYARGNTSVGTLSSTQIHGFDTVRLHMQLMACWDRNNVVETMLFFDARTLDITRKV